MASSIMLPNPQKVLAAQSQPELGPRMLFFSGGTSLGPTSQALIGYTTNSVHLVTPFDSGGSSAELRRYFAMPAVGDLRNRLTALAGCAIMSGCLAVRDLLDYRLPQVTSSNDLRAELEALANGSHVLSQGLDKNTGEIVQKFLQYFIQSIGLDFNLAGASIGNLILASGYLQYGRDPDPVVLMYTQLVQSQGEARLILNANLHLCAILANGLQVVGQHLLTGKEAPPLTEMIKNMHLVDPAQNNCPVRPGIDDQCQQAILSADLICYPMGSFYSSIIANLLPAGVGQAISQAKCPKVFVPNTFFDPESVGLSLTTQVQTLLSYLCLDDPKSIFVPDVLNFVLLDPQIDYPGFTQTQSLGAQGVRVIKTSLVNPRTRRIDPHLLCQALISLARSHQPN